jgi:DNA (cytosine-5)-methyltransferase 1
MTDAAYYNEIDPKAAKWLRELIKAGHIAPGDVDERSIVDVKASELAGYTQCHFFAGIGIWSAAFRLAGIPDSRPVWSGSCPCQEYSVAGKGKGASGDKDLWPVFASLIAERHPTAVYGEQVAAAIGYGWLDRVRTDLEAENYAVGGVVLGAHSAGAPHIRQRLWWQAAAEGAEQQGSKPKTGQSLFYS